MSFAADTMFADTSYSDLLLNGLRESNTVFKVTHRAENERMQSPLKDSEKVYSHKVCTRRMKYFKEINKEPLASKSFKKIHYRSCADIGISIKYE